MTVWTISEPKIGTLSQCVSVARHFEPQPIEKVVFPRRGLRRLFDPPLYTKGETAPTLIVSCGFRAEKRVVKAKEMFGEPMIVHLQPPVIPGYDLSFVSRHDWKPDFDRRPSYHPMIGVPHRFTESFWETRRQSARKTYSADNARVVTVLLGGSNGAYAYDDSTHATIKRAVESLIGGGWKVLISVSRRSSADTLSAVSVLRSPQVEIWDRVGPNPYLDYVAAADAFLIAKDSVTMPCEALSTGKPVYILDITRIPGDRLAKFEWYHSDLQNTLALTRPFEGALTPYDYQSPDEALRISKIIEQTHGFRR